MKFELKNIQHAVFASEETNCYSAVLYIDGVPSVEVSNDGHGGSDMQHQHKKSRYTIEQINTHILATLGMIETDIDNHKEPGKKFSYKSDLETVCADLFEEWLNKKELKKFLKSKLLFVEPGKADQVMASSYKGVRSLTPRHLERFQRENPKVKFLNTMPFEDAYKIYEHCCVTA